MIADFLTKSNLWFELIFLISLKLNALSMYIVASSVIFFKKMKVLYIMVLDAMVYSQNKYSKTIIELVLCEKNKHLSGTLLLFGELLCLF